MTVTPDDSARLRHVGVLLLSNLTSFSALTLLHGNDDIGDLLNALTRLWCIHSGLLYCSTHCFVCPNPHR